MKKLVIAGMLISMIPFIAQADNSGPGCGLGTEIFKGKSGLGSNILASTTNGLFGNQTFGMSFGTLGCDAEKTVSNEYQKEIFVASNADNIARDAARGEGEYLDALASLFEINAEDKEHFNALAQRDFGQIFSTQAEGSATILGRFDQSMLQDAKLAKYIQ